ncbi:MAG: response regulator [Holosporales bacterium]|jgi:two-component system cell cycle response regulator DivK
MADAFTPACILIAEDRPESVKLFADVLEVRGYRVVKVMDGREVLGAVETHRPDMILMDIALPGMSGTEITRRIRADEALKHIPILACTAFSMPVELAEIKASGVDKVVVKPFGIFDLLRDVADMVPKEKVPEGARP